MVAGGGSNYFDSGFVGYSYQVDISNQSSLQTTYLNGNASSFKIKVAQDRIDVLLSNGTAYNKVFTTDDH